jgi:poly-beta-1,6-N-acetyl-D-glucosamine synthase
MFEDLVSLLRENRRLQTHLEAMTQQLNRLREANAASRQKLIEKNRILQEQLAAVEREIAHIHEENAALLAALGQEPAREAPPESSEVVPKPTVQQAAHPESQAKLKVAAIIPAHNEDRSIAQCLESLVHQTYPIEKIIVVNDGSTDWTELVVAHLSQKYPQIECITKQADGTLRAGAVNTALKALFQSDYDLVLIGDADAVFAPDLVEQAVRMFERDEKIGGVCSAVELQGQGLLHRLQKLEYGGFNADRVATWRNILIIHGVCGVYRLEALRQVKGYRIGHLIEDYDLTLRLKKKGWKAVFNPKMRVITHSVPSWRQLARQRIRWYRGGVQVLLDHGINRFTALDSFNHVHFLLLLAVISLIVGMGLQTTGRLTLQLWWHPIPIAVFVVGWLGSLVQLRFVKGLDWKDVLIRVVVLPELFYYTFLSLLRLYSYALELVSARKRW